MFNITVVAFGKEPDLSEEKITDYRGFDPALIGKPTLGSQHLYTVKTEVPDANVVHVQVRDAHVHSPNMVLVFENAFPEKEVVEGSPEYQRYQLRTASIIKETMYRLGVYGDGQMKGPWLVDRVLAFTFNNVDKAISNDLAKAARESFKSIK